MPQPCHCALLSSLSMDMRYSFSDYDQHLCLKAPALLWVAALYLSRAISLPLLAGLASFTGVNSDATSLIEGFFSIHTLLPSVIAATVLYALIRRAPGASRPVRWIWAQGRLILISAAVLDFALTLFTSPPWRVDAGEVSGAALLPAVFDLYFVVYLIAARRARDAFGDFPAPAEPAKRSGVLGRSAPRNDA